MGVSVEFRGKIRVARLDLRRMAMRRLVGYSRHGYGY